MLTQPKQKVAAGIVLLMLLVFPAPLLPPHPLAEAIQSLLGVSWKAAYLAAAIGLRALFYGSLGVIAAFAAGEASSRRERVVQWIVAPLAVVLVATVVRSLKVGHFPNAANVIVPLAACLSGVGIGLMFRQRGWRTTLIAAGIAGATLLWMFFPGVSSRIERGTEERLQKLVAAKSNLPPGDARFGAFLKIVFEPTPALNAVEDNRAAFLALGIAIGHERLARFAGLKRQDTLVRDAASLREGLTLHGRQDWPRHFCLSAALTVLENPFISDAGGLVKEELDALSKGSGFSFGDIAADRAGVRFARAATDSEEAAKAMQGRLQQEFVVGDFFPTMSDLPENLTVEQFRQDFGGVGDKRYRQKVSEIEERLNQCPGLSIQHAP